VEEVEEVEEVEVEEAEEAEESPHPLQLEEEEAEVEAEEVPPDDHHTPTEDSKETLHSNLMATEKEAKPSC